MMVLPLIDSLLATVAGSDVSGTALVAFDAAKEALLSQKAGLMTTCKALCALFCIILLVGVVRDIVQETAGGHGDVPLGRILRPFFIMLLLVSFPMLRSACDKVFGGAGRLGAGAFKGAATKLTKSVDLKESWDKSTNAWYNGEEESYTNAEGNLVIQRTYKVGLYDDDLVAMNEQGGQELSKWFRTQWLNVKRFFARVEYFLFDVSAGLIDGIGGLIFAICQYIVCCYASIMLGIMAALGPIAITFSALPPYKSAAKDFFGKYITYCMWFPIAGVTMAVASSAASSVTMSSNGNLVIDIINTILKLLVYLGGCHMLFQTGSIANDAVSLADTSGLNGATGAGMAVVGAAANEVKNLAKGVASNAVGMTKGLGQAAVAGALMAGGMSMSKAGAVVNGDVSRFKELDKMEGLEKGNASLAKQLKSALGDNASMKSELDGLKAENTGLKAENTGLKAKFNGQVKSSLQNSLARGSSRPARNNSNRMGHRRRH